MQITWPVVVKKKNLAIMLMLLALARLGKYW